MIREMIAGLGQVLFPHISYSLYTDAEHKQVGPWMIQCKYIMDFPLNVFHPKFAQI